MATKAKKDRETCYKSSERTYDVIKGMLDEKAAPQDLEAELKKLEDIFDNLSGLHGAYKELGKSEDLRNEGNYLQIPSRRVGEVKGKISKAKELAVKEAEKALRAQEAEELRKSAASNKDKAVEANSEQATALKAELQIEMNMFNDTCDGLEKQKS